MSGMAALDQPRVLYLVALALAVCCDILKPDGGLVVKLFQGEGSEAFLKETRSCFEPVVIRKPGSSRRRLRGVCRW